MKKFVELVKRMHSERYSVTINKIISEKIPLAFLTIAPVENVLSVIKDLRNQGLFVNNLITLQNPIPPPWIQTCRLI